MGLEMGSREGEMRCVGEVCTFGLCTEVDDGVFSEGEFPGFRDGKGHTCDFGYGGSLPGSQQ